MQAPVRFAILITLISTGLMAADPPYAGKWKVNPTKSDFGEVTVTYEQMPGGAMKVTVDGLSYTFKADGKEYPTPWGTAAAWKSIDSNTWETTNKVNGKATGTDTMKLSADGKTLTVDSKVMKVSGESSNDSAAYQRVSGGPGLAGKWKAKNVKMSAPGVLFIGTNGSDGLTLKYVDDGGMCDAKVDGKDYPATGAMWPAGWSCVVGKSGANAFNTTWKKDGKAMYKSTFTTSADGKTMTEASSSVATTEKTRIVYDRQ
jgi:hypothetical protein